MNQVPKLCQKIFFLLLSLTVLYGKSGLGQTAFTSPSITSQTGASNSYTSTVVSPETVQPSNGCGETGANWTHNFLGTSNKRLASFTIVSTNYFVNNFGSLSTTMRRNNAAGTINPSSCLSPPPAIPWHDRQVAFYEGSEDTVGNIANIVSTFPSTTTPGSPSYNTVADMNMVFSRGFINSGADNIFNNNSGTGAGFNSNANNIERMDLFVSGGVNVTAANMTRTGIVIVCRGPADDPLVLSAIKALSGGTNSGGGTTYIYDDVIKINATWTSKTINGGSAVAIGATQKTTLISGINSVIVRRTDSDGSINDQLPAASYPTVSSYVLNQNIVAMFFTFQDLGLVAGDVFYGYSVSGYDVTATNSTQFNSYLNSSIFPLNTDPANGGVDLTGFPGLFSPMDIDDDDDGLPDYLEANLALTFGDADSDGILNYCDATYPGFIDNNTDGINDNFDPSADSDNDGIPNYRDNSFVTWGWVDSNGDSVNDIFDWDLDGIPNQLDRDSDNDGLPDVVESFGVDANGDGVIDNYTDTDVDGFSQNVDANSTGAISSGAGLTALDTDSDGIPNYFDHDSDNDGIPDVVEGYATDSNNNGVIDGYTDTDGDGYADIVDADVGNDNVAENSAASILKTGSDGNGDGRTDSWPNKNMESDARPNPYDLDSDGDGITDVKEAQFTDANWDGRVDGPVNSKGWNTVIAAQGSLNLPNTDAVGRANPYDIDSDEDGIPDNVEGMTTAGYILPGVTTDTDNDGIIDLYDNVPAAWGGDGIHPVDKDGDTIPDYLDSDTDGDGKIDRIEGNDFNFNGYPDDLVTLTGVDTDGDGLDDRFDANNSSVEATSAYMGNGGSTSGDVTPGSTTVVQRTPLASNFGCSTERDWRCVFYVLNCQAISFSAVLNNKQVKLDWTVLCDQPVDHFIIQRSTDRSVFTDISTVAGRTGVNGPASYTDLDNISGIVSEMIFYRLISITIDGKKGISQVIAVRNKQSSVNDLQILPNPVRDQLQVLITTSINSTADITLIDAAGKVMMKKKERLLPGNNTFTYPEAVNLAQGIYFLRLNIGELVLTKKISIVK